MQRYLIATSLAIFLPGAAFAVGETVDYTAGDRAFEGYVARAENPKGAVVLIHDWDGLTDYEKQRADMLAELGYDAFAIDLYGKDVRPATPEANRAETEKLYSDRAMMRTLMDAGLAAAREAGLGEVIVAGYCFGGAAALEMARQQPDGVIGYAMFHAGLDTPDGEDFAAATAPMRIYHGGADQNPDMAGFAGFIEKLEAAGTPYKAEVYAGAPHAFTVFESDRYRDEADARSWADFQAFLTERFE